MKNKEIITKPKLVFVKRFLVPALTAGEVYRIPITAAMKTDYSHFNELIIDNANGTSEIEVVPDNDTNKSIFVEKGVVWIESFKDDNLKFQELKVIELDSAAVGANLVRIQIKKKVHVLEVVRAA